MQLHLRRSAQTIRHYYRMHPRHLRLHGKPKWWPHEGKFGGGCAKNGLHPDTMYRLFDPQFGLCYTKSPAFPRDCLVGISIRPWRNQRDRRAMCQRGKWMIETEIFDEPHVWSLSHVRRRGWMKFS